LPFDPFFAGSSSQPDLYRFWLLEKEHKIAVTIEKGADFQPRTSSYPVLKVILNDSVKLIYETHDKSQIESGYLDWADYYFKRSYAPGEHAATPKIFPLGFNYAVAGRNDYSFQRHIYALQTSKRIDKTILRPLLDANALTAWITKEDYGFFTSAVEKFEGLPDISSPPVILFLTRVWEPGSTTDKENRELINEMRVGCMEKLREAFPDTFVGGLYPTPYAMEKYSQYVVKDASLTWRVNYLHMLKNASICVATKGLWNSNGGKMGEYIAGAKAIVAERLYHSVPGDFLPERNYLEFTTPEECVERVKALVSNPALRYQMMLNNLAYYHAYLRPDILIWNSLQRVLFHE
jgi:hypothetical protein